MDKEITVELTCKHCAAEFVGKYLLNIRTSSDGDHLINQPLGTLNLAEDEIELQCADSILSDALTLSYVCKGCGSKNELLIPITNEMKHVDHMI
jgi:DNA-directed RNA polymerase subunit RPC12/RpoP